MKSPSVRPCSAPPWQKAAQWSASAQKVRMVSDCAVSSAESDPAAINNAAAEAPSHWRTIILTCTSGRAPRPRTLLRRSRRCDSDNDYPMNDAGEIRKQAEGGLVVGRRFANPIVVCGSLIEQEDAS